MAKYQNKYRVESARAGWWDYGSPVSMIISSEMIPNINASTIT